MQKEILINEMEKIMEEKLRDRIEKEIHEAKIASIIDDVITRKVSTLECCREIDRYNE